MISLSLQLQCIQGIWPSGFKVPSVGNKVIHHEVIVSVIVRFAHVLRVVKHNRPFVVFTIEYHFLLIQTHSAKMYFAEDTPALERECTWFLSRVFTSLCSLKRGSFSSNAAQDFTLAYKHFLMSHPMEGNGNTHMCATKKQLQNPDEMLRSMVIPSGLTFSASPVKMSWLWSAAPA